MGKEELVLEVDTNALEALYKQIEKDSDLVTNPGNFFLEKDGVRVEYAPVKHAHWEWDDELGANICSSCGRPTYDSHDECVDFMGSKVLALVSPYYCGYCGARMDGGKDHE